MTLETENKTLARLVKDWQGKRRIALVLRAFSVSIAAACLAFFLLQSDWSSLAIIVVAAFLIAGAVLYFLEERAAFDERSMARHLNRIMPETEESCELLLRSPETLNALERAQREKAARQIEKTNFDLLLPQSPLFSALRFSALVLGATAIISLAGVLLPKASFFQTPSQISRTESGGETTTRPNPISIEKLRIQITPPAYTKRKPHNSKKLALRAEENAWANWRIDFNQAIASARLIFSGGDSVNLKKESQNRFSVKKQIQSSGFYFLSATSDHGATWSSDYAKIEMIKDAPPDVTLLTPEQRTELEWTDSHEIGVEALMSDDYQISKTFIIATVTKGGGENVKFREDTLQFDARKNEKRFGRYSKTIDLNHLGMAPGDELYFYVEAVDNREPEPNLARTETHFVVIRDTSEVMALSTDGIAVNIMPDYFRSQRQIIIDTIELIKEKDEISAGDFKSRSNELAHDQKSLRLRYGQFLGEEFDSGLSESEFDLEELGLESEDDAFGGHAHAEELVFDPTQGFVGLDLAADGVPLGNDDELVQQFMHDHDNAENATLFSQSVRSQLKDALTEMWDAELQLRLFEPKKALPYEYQALKLLKSVQQRSRLYVKRIGFEPPPLQPLEKRLSGDLDEIAQKRVSGQAESAVTMPEIRAGLKVIEDIFSKDKRAADDAILTLERAGQKLAEAAISEPGNYLDALQKLRGFIASADEEPQEFCSDCLVAVRSAFWQILPQETPSPGQATRPQGPLAQKYFQALDAIR